MLDIAFYVDALEVVGLGWEWSGLLTWVLFAEVTARLGSVSVRGMVVGVYFPYCLEWNGEEEQRLGVGEYLLCRYLVARVWETTSSAINTPDMSSTREQLTGGETGSTGLRASTALESTSQAPERRTALTVQTTSQGDLGHILRQFVCVIPSKYNCSSLAMRSSPRLEN